MGENCFPLTPEGELITKAPTDFHGFHGLFPYLYDYVVAIGTDFYKAFALFI